VASWSEIVAAFPEFAEAVQTAFDAYKHKTLATTRRDGSPRISGIEATFADGELWLGMMPRSLKALDLLRDPRLALHSATVDTELLHGDAKLAGRAIEVTDPAAWHSVVEGGVPPQADAHLFRVDIIEVSLTRIGDPPDHLVIEYWSEGRGYRQVQRY
jgi:hypothetical protein